MESGVISTTQPYLTFQCLRDHFRDGDHLRDSDHSESPTTKADFRTLWPLFSSSTSVNHDAPAITSWTKENVIMRSTELYSCASLNLASFVPSWYRAPRSCSEWVCSLDKELVTDRLWWRAIYALFGLFVTGLHDVISSFNRCSIQSKGQKGNKSNKKTGKQKGNEYKTRCEGKTLTNKVRNDAML